MPSRLRLSRASQSKIIAAIPCFNTEPFIRDLVTVAREYVDQVIVLNDGSQDGTARAAETAGAVVINHDRNRGYGVAINSCFEWARMNAVDILVILDGDNQHDPKEIPQVLTPILRGEADLVIGSRLPTGLNYMPKYRKFGIRVITFLWNLGSKVRVSDAQSGFRAYSKKIFMTFPLYEKGMSVSIESLEIARGKGAIIKEVPISCFYMTKPIHLKDIMHGLSLVLGMVRIRLMKKRR
ncbi:glycosyltransferase family 2 protein [Chloroflexota bacterium]